MNDDLIVATYVMVDDTMKLLGQRSHCLANLSDAEVLTVAVLAAHYCGTHHARAGNTSRGAPTFQGRSRPRASTAGCMGCPTGWSCCWTC